MRPGDGRVVSNFIVQALRGDPLSVYGDGSQTRSFCYVDDLVEGIYRLLLSDYHLPVNIGNPSEITIKEFGEEIARLTGVEFKPTYQALPENDPMKRRPDITLAREVLGWEPRVPLEEGLRRTIPYFAELVEHQAARTL
ncbi:MAG TPA: GDP-mannose 4,6-dehydratase [Longimicrobium sp.]|nr:GDP-mannose 4,6-dehydratase [Longimicrobium sp.]